MTRHQQRFTHIHPFDLSLTCSTRMERAPLGVNPKLRTPRLPVTHVGAGTDLGHWSEITSSTFDQASNRCDSLNACDFRVARPLRTVRVPTSHGPATAQKTAKHEGLSEASQVRGGVAHRGAYRGAYSGSGVAALAPPWKGARRHDPPPATRCAAGRPPPSAQCAQQAVTSRAVTDKMLNHSTIERLNSPQEER